MKKIIFINIFQYFLILFYGVFICLQLSCSEVPLDLVEVKQPDGTVFFMRLEGDQFFLARTDENGFVLAMNKEDGFWYYALSSYTVKPLYNQEKDSTSPPVNEIIWMPGTKKAGHFNPALVNDKIRKENNWAFKLSETTLNNKS